MDRDLLPQFLSPKLHLFFCQSQNYSVAETGPFFPESFYKLSPTIVNRTRSHRVSLLASSTNPRSVFQREIDSSNRIDFSVTFSTNFDLCFTHFLPQTFLRCLILSTGLCAKSRLMTSKAAIASCIEIRSSLETCPPSDARARIASSAALTRSRSLFRLISKTAVRYSCHQSLPNIFDS
jgi:hypothetical protein